MKKFTYKFAAVEKLRGIQMDQQAKALSIVDLEVQRVEAQKDELINKLKDEFERIKRLPAFLPEEHHVKVLSENYRSSLKGQIRKKGEELLKVKQRQLAERQKLVEVQKKKKAMEKLRERMQEDYNAEMRRYENQEMDEISSNLWIYRSLSKSK